MTTNPFGNSDDTHPVLVNDEGQHSPRPAFVDVPPGWLVVPAAGREVALAYVNENWVDMRPRSLVDAGKVE